MSADKRSTHTDALGSLGTLELGENPGRDAIHLAVEPIVAAEKLYPGQDIGITEGKASGKVEKKLGIVDPFLKQPVEEGERFWLVVYPRQITSLRHVWSHPDFAEGIKKDNPSSEQWMKEWAKKHMSYDYYGDGENIPDEQAYANAIKAGHNYHVGPYEDARDHIDNEWWSHWENITGATGDRDAYFLCSC